MRGAVSTVAQSVLPSVKLIGESPAMAAAIELIRRIARTEASVLIEGETGTGKELAARAIHSLGARREYPFIPVNCGALPEGLIENELFGHRRGAFTGGQAESPGLMRLAHRGTLFLDEIDALPPKAQVVLLRFLQDRKEESDVRIIAASNAHLADLVARECFRPDLYFRLRIMSVTLPPLRERVGDVERLASHFVRDCASLYGLPEKPLHLDSVEWLRSYGWPGNVRELENLIHREFLLSDSSPLRLSGAPSANDPTVQDGPATMPASDSIPHYRAARSLALEAFDRQYLADVLARTRGNVTRAAKMAGKERRALGKLIKRYAIQASSYRV
jgi:DNA-binding NtrC family response regulator